MELTKIPREFCLQHKFVTLTADVMFVNGIAFLISFSRNIKLLTVEHVPNRTVGQFRCFNFLFCKILEILSNRFDHNSSFLEVSHVYVGHPLTQTRVSFELNSSSLGSGHDPLLLRVIRNVIPIRLKTRDREEVGHSLFVHPHVEFTPVTFFVRGCDTGVTVPM